MARVSTPPTAVSASTLSVSRPNTLSVGTIVWLSSELMFFAGLFAMYFTHRSVSADIWASESDRLNLPFSLTNTVILVLSSVTCQLGVFAAERFQARRTGPIYDVRRWGMVEWIVLTYLMGSVFVAGQVTEYFELVNEGLTISSSPYGSVFYMATGFHGLHVVGGLLAFLFVIARSFAANRFGHHEAGATIVVSYYWHFVDAVWIALFAVIYLIR